MGDSLVSDSQFCVIVILIILFVMDMHKIFLVCFSGGEGSCPLCSWIFWILWPFIQQERTCFWCFGFSLLVPLTKDLGIPHQFQIRELFQE